ncbi:MAG: DNA gyrase subunit A, partial [Bdellovibrionales bacterium]|nr:DNA gyrase subunit A [Bdellovibrionales bacterium]
NYDNSLKEPDVLPSRIPNLLVNGSAGIAVGMATNVPPHNLSEIIEGVKLLLKNKDTSIDDLIKIIPGPDFPTGAFIYGRSGMREIYRTGKGVIRLRAKAEIEEGKKDKEQIIVTEIPFQVNKARLIEHVAHLVRDKKIDGITDLRDESDRKGMRIVFELRKGEDSRVILNQLYKNTQMQTSFGVSMLALDHQQPKLLNLKDLLTIFINHRKEVVTRRTAFELKKAEEKAHILEALKKAVENLDEVVALIRKAQSPAVAQEQLIAKFDFSEAQAKAILEMRLSRLTGLEREKIIEDYNATMNLIKELKSILADEEKVVQIILKELDEVKKAFGDDRRTQFIDEQEELTVEDLIQEESMFVTVTYSGYVKRVPPSTYRAQKRGGKGVIGAATKAEDFIKDIFVASTHDYVLCFTDQGRVYWLKVHKIPEGGRTARGKAIINLLNLAPQERVQAILPVKEFKDTEYVVMVTKKGVIKKTSLGAFARPMKRGIIALTIDPSDSVVDARVTDGAQEIILVSRNGQSIRFSEGDVREMGRSARGVTGMRFKEDDDEVVGMSIVTPDARDSHLLTVTDKGFGKRTAIEEYRVQGRGGSGIRTMKITDKNGPVVAVRYVHDEDEIIIASDKGKVMRTKVSEISEVGRVAQGVRLIKVADDERVGAVATIVKEDEE